MKMKGILTKAAITRRVILQKAFQKIYQKGYQFTSIDNILNELDVTKGAFYYHFKNKKEMGIGVIKDVIFPKFNQSMILPLKQIEHPKDGIIRIINQKLENLPELEIMLGCPLHNLMIEMGGVDDDFATEIRAIIQNWQEELEAIIEKGIERGDFPEDTDANSLANFIIASYHGIRSRLKIEFDLDLVDQYMFELGRYLS